MLVQLIGSRMLWPQAVLTGPELQTTWWLGSGHSRPVDSDAAVDLYFIIRVGKFDHGETVKYFDQAESWLGWKGPLVRASHSAS